MTRAERTYFLGPIAPSVGGVTEPTLPNRATEDTDDAWGEQPEDNDDRLEDDRPPHYDER